KTVGAVHRHAVTVRVDQPFVHPVRQRRELGVVDLARRDHHLARLTADDVTIDVHIGKVVVGANGLYLAERVLQRAPVPQTNVVEALAVVWQVKRFDGVFRFEVAQFDLVQPKTSARPFDVVGDVRCLAVELVRLDDEALDVRRNQYGCNHVRRDGKRETNEQDAETPYGERVNQQDDRCDDQDNRDNQQRG